MEKGKSLDDSRETRQRIIKLEDLKSTASFFSKMYAECMQNGGFLYASNDRKENKRSKK